MCSWLVFKLVLESPHRPPPPIASPLPPAFWTGIWFYKENCLWSTWREVDSFQKKIKIMFCKSTITTRMYSSWGCVCVQGGVRPPRAQRQIPPAPFPWTEWLTDRCKNNTLPQTSFVGGKNENSCYFPIPITRLYLSPTIVVNSEAAHCSGYCAEMQEAKRNKCCWTKLFLLG